MPLTKSPPSLWEELETKAKSFIESTEEGDIKKRHQDFLETPISVQVAKYLKDAKLGSLSSEIATLCYRDYMQSVIEHGYCTIPGISDLKHQIERSYNGATDESVDAVANYFHSCPDNWFWAFLTRKQTKKQVQEQYEAMSNEQLNGVIKFVQLLQILHKVATLYIASDDVEHKKKGRLLTEVLCQMKEQLFRVFTQIQIQKVLGTLDQLGYEHVLAPIGELLANNAKISEMTGVRVVVDEIGLYEEAALEVEEITRDKAKARR